MNRIARAGVASCVVVAGLAATYLAWPRARSCASAQSDAIGCVGAGLEQAALALVAGWVLVALALKGRGLAHAVVGAGVCLYGGFLVTSRLSSVVALLPEDSLRQRLLAAVLLGLTAGALAALWAWLVPGWWRRSVAADH